ncbi:MAG: 3-deoxy-manno-octulosonate cytidylyltransferase [Planctomycetia bacterium]|nr:3-deoxy-manno-octulosonate cytidylyltransferase [Planctomycetia bacterium]
MPPSQSAIIVIPARLSSQRLPRKMLLADTGHPLIEHTWRAARTARRADAVLVATDSEEIAAAVRAFGGEAVLTSPDAPSGTARIVEALPRIPEASVIVNVQGDEPELAGTAIDTAIDLLDRCPEAGVATLVTPLRSKDDLLDPSAVKAVLTPWREASAEDGTAGSVVPDAWRALYFSRSPVPAARDWSDALLTTTPPLYWQHVGLYAYRRSVLEQWNDLPESRLAAVESLEQLRVIEAGIPIVAGAVAHAARGIDTPKDYAAFVARSRSTP